MKIYIWFIYLFTLSAFCFDFISLSVCPIAFLFSPPNLFSGGGDSLGLLMLSSQLIVYASMHHSS